MTGFYMYPEHTPQRLSDERFREEDLLEASPIGLVDAELQWDNFDLPEEAAEEVGSEASALRERSVPEQGVGEQWNREPA
jgi:hypothetical protein